MTLNTPTGEKPELAIFKEKGEGSYKHEKGVRTDGHSLELDAIKIPLL